MGSQAPAKENSGEANGAEIQAKLLDSSIRMCYERICQRLGVVNTNGRTRTSIRQILVEVIKELRRYQPTWTVFVDKARHILSLIDAWLNHRVFSKLRDIVDAMYDLSHSAVWESVKVSMPPLDIQSGQIDRLIRAVDKLSRYKEVSRYLYRTAKKYPIARLVRVRVVDLSSTTFERSPPEDFVGAELDRSFERVRVDKQTLDKVCALLGRSLSRARYSFDEAIKPSRDRPVIHAEVQLLAYCDLDLRGMKPRVICSSKKACFMCNFLIKTHGKMYTPHTHGRLYRGWRLTTADGHQLANELNLALEGRLKESLTWMRRENRRIKHPLPENESATHTLILSSTTLVETESTSGGIGEERDEVDGLAAAAKSTTPENPELAAGNDRISPSAEPHSSPADPTPVPPRGHEPLTEISANIDARKGVPVKKSDFEQDASEQANGNGTSTDDKTGGHVLRPGKALSKPLTIGRGNPQLFISDSFDLLVDRGGLAKCSPQRLTCDMCWVTGEEASIDLEQNGSLIVDIDTLGEVTLPLNGPMTFFLRDGDRCVLRVSINADIPR